MAAWKSSVRVLFRTILPMTLGMVGLVAVIAWLAGAFTDKIPPGRVEAVAQTVGDRPTDVVHEVNKDYIEEAVGTLKAASRAEVSSRILATINEIKVSAGDLVTEGDVLVQLDDAQVQAQVQQAEQALVSAKASRQQAATDFSRAEELKKRKVASQSEYDAAKARLDVAAAEVARANQAVEEAKAVLSYTTIMAPKAGRVVDRLAEPGDTARPGQPLLVIYDSASLRLEAPVLEKLAVRLKVGDRLKVHVDALNRDVEAVIDQIVPQADAPSRSFLVKATVPRADDLFEGMFGRLLIPAGVRRHLCLATDAIQQIGQLEFVQVVRDDQTMERRMIRTGRLGMPGRVEVLSGLQAGETVVLKEQTEIPKPSNVQDDNKPQINADGH
ncbi:MAG: efflux RND transporter periplasmic adaptor subunit [Planctomycetaceae bacterium]